LHTRYQIRADARAIRLPAAHGSEAVPALAIAGACVARRMAAAPGTPGALLREYLRSWGVHTVRIASL
jgi:hypothetical protein